MRQDTFTLPSSVQIEFRQVMLAEENTLAAASKNNRSNLNQTLSSIMTGCAVRVVDPGPYSFLEMGGKPDWGRMARGDRFTGMIDLRCLSYREGYLYEAPLHCPAGMCGHGFGWEIDLNKDLVRQDMTPEAIEKLKNGDPFEMEIAGKLVKYTIAYGKTEDANEKLCLQFPGRDMACALRARIVSVEGVKPHEIMDWLDGNNADPKCKFPGISSDDAEDLRDAFDRIDGGIDTELEAECPRCHTWFEFELPFTGIFLPGKGISKRRRELRKQASEEKLEAERQEMEKPKTTDTEPETTPATESTETPAESVPTTTREEV